LALGIGVTSAIYAAFDVWLLRPLPLPEPDQLVRVWKANETGGSTFLSAQDFESWGGATEAVELAGHTRTSMNFLMGGEAEHVRR
jgi:hypothetical protein